LGAPAAVGGIPIASAILLPADHLHAESAWNQHIPFAFWLVQAHRPSVFVELGTFLGTSYFSFCQAVAALRLPTRCFAVDTWSGESHTGLYDESVFTHVNACNELKYAGFSRLVRSSFDEALPHFLDGSIDLLHIDGLHTYGACRHDFESWLPKLSRRAIVLFHDTNVRERDFGVHRLWAELAERYPHFEFVHEHGLGVLGVGAALDAPVRELFAAADDGALTAEIRKAFWRLASVVRAQIDLQASGRERARLETRLSAMIREHEAEISGLTAEQVRLRLALEEKQHQAVQLTAQCAALCSEKAELGTALAAAGGEKAVLGTALTAARNRNARLEAALATAFSEKAELDTALASARTEKAEVGAALTAARSEKAELRTRAERAEAASAAARKELEAIRRSTGWRITRPLRQINSARSRFARHTARAIRRVTWTGVFGRRLHAYFVLRENIKLIAASGLLDHDWYLEQYPDVRAVGVNSVAHYLRHGADEGRDPNPFFYTDWYLDHYPDVRAAEANPLVHYLQHGATEGRDPSPLFDTDWYLDRYADVRAAGMNPLAHYLRHGADERREAKPPPSYQQWIEAYDIISAFDISEMQRLSKLFPNRPLISLVMPTYNTPEKFLREAIESVRTQTYDGWELCIADDCSTEAHVRRVLAEYAQADPRIKVIHRENNGHICNASNSALELATGEWVVLLDHDDLLAPHALFCVVDIVNRHKDVMLIYSDEDKIGPEGTRRDPYFKSDWNPDLFLSHNMFSHLGAYRRDLVTSAGGFRPGYEGAQDYDLALRCIERVSHDQIYHIPHVLYHWRMGPGSTALNANEKPYAMAAGERAINGHLQRTKSTGRAKLIGFGYRVQYKLPLTRPLVSIIIPARNGCDLVRRCLTSIQNLTTYSPYEIILVDNGSTDPISLAFFKELSERSEIRFMTDNSPFNYSALNNMAAEVAAGSILALINNDIEVLSPDWLSEMVSIAIQPGVGAVGARLWYPDDTLQHGGLILSPLHVAMNVHKRIPRTSFGYFGRAALQQSISAVTAACLVVRKDLYFMVGGLNYRDLPIAYNDVDFCLRLSQRGFRNVWTPYAELYHHESATRGGEDTAAKLTRLMIEQNYMRERWKNQLSNDPAYNPNLSIERDDFTLSFPPRVQRPWRVQSLEMGQGPMGSL